MKIRPLHDRILVKRLDEETMGMGTTDYNFDLVR